MTPEELLDLAERATQEARDRMRGLGRVVQRWEQAPRRAVLRDAEGDLLHLCSDGTWCSARSDAVPNRADMSPSCGPWTVVAVDVADAYSPLRVSEHWG